MKDDLIANSPALGLVRELVRFMTVVILLIGFCSTGYGAKQCDRLFNGADPRAEYLYDRLGVSKTATKREIRVAFLKVFYHLNPPTTDNPDKIAPNPKLARLIERVNEAFKVLWNDEERARYDRQYSPSQKSGDSAQSTYWAPRSKARPPIFTDSIAQGIVSMQQAAGAFDSAGVALDMYGSLLKQQKAYFDSLDSTRKNAETASKAAIEAGIWQKIEAAPDAQTAIVEAANEIVKQENLGRRDVHGQMGDKQILELIISRFAAEPTRVKESFMNAVYDSTLNLVTLDNPRRPKFRDAWQNAQMNIWNCIYSMITDQVSFEDLLRFSLEFNVKVQANINNGLHDSLILERVNQAIRADIYHAARKHPEWIPQSVEGLPDDLKEICSLAQKLIAEHKEALKPRSSHP